MSELRATSALVRTSFGARRKQILERLSVAVHANGERIALGDDVLRHAVAHQPQSDETDARLRFCVHVSSPVDRIGRSK